MDSNIVQAEYDVLETIAGRFARQAESTADMRLHLLRHVQTLQNGGWEGKGSEAFFAEMDKDIFPAVIRLGQALEQARSVTLQVRDVLKAAEEEAASPFRNGAEGRDFAGKGKLDEKSRISGYTTAGGKLFDSGAAGEPAVHPNDISQGQLGDCFLVTSLAVAASQNPGLIQNAVKDNGDGTYTVTFYEKRGGFLGIGDSYQPVQIKVTPDFPVREVYDKETGKWVADGNAPHIGTGDNELWPRLIEKAYGQWKGDGNVTKGYDILNDGGQSQNVMEALAGTDSKSTTNMKKYSLAELGEMHKNGTAITLSSLDSTDGSKKGSYNAGSGQLHTNHAYWVESVDVANNKVVVRNPWGYNSSSTHRIELTYDEFTKNFDRIDTNTLQR